jgi:oligopeptide transport system permease protein
MMLITAFQTFFRSKRACWALGVLLLMAGLCFLGPLLSPYGEAQVDMALGARAPSLHHWLGTDLLGRDLATRVLYGGRVSLQVGLLATLVASCIGLIYGLISGLAGPRVDALMMRVVDVLYAFPLVTFVVLLVVVFERQFWLIYAAIGAVEWLTVARVVRGQTLALKNQEFIQAARACGATRWRLLWRHLLPHLMGTVIVYASLTVPGVMLLEATLSFLGLGIQPPAASWGILISEGAASLATQPWLLLAPAVFFMVTLASLNELGHALSRRSF